jgi:predicted outer membrane repeat protein
MKHNRLNSKRSLPAGLSQAAGQRIAQGVLLVVCALALSGAALAGTITVNSTAQRGSGTSSVCTIGAAIIAANTNVMVDGCTGATASLNTIMVPAGTYTLTVADNAGSFGRPFGLPGIQSDITITGLFGPDATAIIERSSANGTPDFGIFDNRQNTGHLTLNNLTIRNGHYANDGAAIFNIGGPTSGGPAALTVNNCLFDSNVSTASGIFGGGGAVGGGGTFNGSSFTNNIAAGDGGAVQGVSVVTNSFFQQNSAGAGGALSGSVTISDSTFHGNFATGGDGGAVLGSGTILRSVFDANGSSNGSGGAVVLSGGTITDSWFLGNIANGTQGNGGAVDVGNNAVTISGSTFEGNGANFRGGAFVGGGGATLINDTFDRNSANSDGGAIFSQNGLILNNVTITRNLSVAGVAGGIAGGGAGGGDDITNSIIAGNTNGSGTNPDCSGNLNSHGHNIIGAGTCNILFVSPATGDQIGTLTAPVDPVLGVLAANSGKTVGQPGETSVITTAALLIGSPALDAGDLGAPGSGGSACAATD